MVIKTQTEYELSSMDQPKKFSDLEAQKLACGHPEEGRRVTTLPCPMLLGANPLGSLRAQESWTGKATVQRQKGTMSGQVPRAGWWLRDLGL